MIAALKGSLRLREAGRIVVETGGVGYELFIPLSTYSRLPAAGVAVELEVRHLVREGAVTLYGFATGAEKQAFDLLTRVQHVGPKLALAVLSVMAPEELATAIVRGDVDRIDAVPGVGRKVAERVVREQRDKVGELRLAAPEPRAGSDGRTQVLDDAVSALVNLGYKRAEAKSAVDSLDTSAAATGVETIIRRSLAALFGKK
jgi:Holliday junction DNA helicase RuvA